MCDIISCLSVCVISVFCLWPWIIWKELWGMTLIQTVGSWVLDFGVSVCYCVYQMQFFLWPLRGPLIQIKTTVLRRSWKCLMFLFACSKHKGSFSKKIGGISGERLIFHEKFNFAQVILHINAICCTSHTEKCYLMHL